MNSTFTINEVDVNNEIVEKIRLYSNIKGSIMVCDTNGNVHVLPPGIDGQVILSDSSVTGGVKWGSLPPGLPSRNTTILYGGIRIRNSATTYAKYNHHCSTITYAATQPTNVMEPVFIPFDSTAIKIQVFPAGGNIWPSDTNLEFRVGKIDNPNAIPTADGIVNGFTAYSENGGTLLTVGSGFNSTNNVASRNIYVPIIAGDGLCVQMINNVASGEGIYLTVSISCRGFNVP